MAMEKFLIFVLKNSNHILKGKKLSFLVSTVYIISVHFTIYNTKHNPPKNYKMYD